MSENITNIILQPKETEDYINDFLKSNQSIIIKRGAKAHKYSSGLAIRAFEESIKMSLRKAYTTFFYNKLDPINLDKYLFGSIMIAIKQLNRINKSPQQICPACQFDGNIEFLVQLSNGLGCQNCQKICDDTSYSEQAKSFHSKFISHSRIGFRCPSCYNFIPNEDQDIIYCPYPNCSFSGSKSQLTKKNHPSIHIEFKETPSIICCGGKSSGTDLQFAEMDQLLEQYYEVVKSCIEDQQKSLIYTAWPSSLVQKSSMYQAFYNLLQKEPSETTGYLAKIGTHSRKNKLQARLFQEFISVLESKIPFTFTCQKKTYTINSILDPILGIFDGTSIFRSEVNDEYIIPNQTKEIYSGNRLEAYHQPFYIGKLIDVVDVNTNQSILDQVEKYSFVNVIMKPSIKIGTKVEIKHYRILPHYYMGPLCCLQRVKKAITDKVLLMLEKKNDK